MVSETGSAFSMRMTSWEKSHGKEQVKENNTGKEQVFSPKESFLRELEVWDHMLERKDESI